MALLQQGAAFWQVSRSGDLLQQQSTAQRRAEAPREARGHRTPPTRSSPGPYSFGFTLCSSAARAMQLHCGGGVTFSPALLLGYYT